MVSRPPFRTSWPQPAQSLPSEHATAARWSDDGRWLATGDVDGAVQLLDGETLAPAAYFVGHRSLVSALRFSPDGAQLASRALDGTLRLWDVAGRRPTLVLRDAKMGGLPHIVFSEDGRLVASPDGVDAVRVWRTDSGAPVTRYAVSAHDLYWQAGALWVLTRDGLLDLSRPIPRARRRRVQAAPTRSRHPDGTIATSGPDDDLVHFTRSDGSRRTHRIGPASQIEATAHGFVVTASPFGPLPCPPDRPPVHVVRSHDLESVALPAPAATPGRAYSTFARPDLACWITVGTGGADLHRAGLPDPTRIPGPARWHAPFVSDGFHAHADTGERALLVDLHTGRPTGEAPSCPYAFDTLRCSDGEHRLRFGAGTVTRLDATGAETGHRANISTRRWGHRSASRDGRFILCFVADGVSVYDVLADRPHATLALATRPTWFDAVWFDPSGDALLTCGDRRLQRWDLHSGAALGALAMPRAVGTRAIAQTRDGASLLAGRGKLCRIEARGRLTHVAHLGRAKVEALHVDAAGAVAAAAFRDGTLTVFDTDTLRALRVVGAVHGGWWTVDLTTGARDGNDVGLAALAEAERLARW